MNAVATQANQIAGNGKYGKEREGEVCETGRLIGRESERERGGGREKD